MTFYLRRDCCHQELQANLSFPSAGSILIHPPSNTDPSISLSNGHLSPLAQNVATPNNAHSPSDSDLSEVAENLDVVATSTEQIGESMKEMEMSESDDVDAEGSDDADYDLDFPPRQRRSSEPDHSSSAESAPSRKRKAPDENDLILQNPELYGLRRSVRAADASLAQDYADLPCQGRARQTNRLVVSHRLFYRLRI